MNALLEVSQKAITTWPARETGLRAYRRISDERSNTIDLPRRQRLEVEKIGIRICDGGNEHPVALDEIRKSFVFREDPVVTSFLSSHRTIPHLLLEALPQLKKVFGNNTVFVLKVLTEEDGARELYLVAVWPGPAREAMKALDCFMEDWWIERSGPVFGRLHFTYELE